MPKTNKPEKSAEEIFRKRFRAMNKKERIAEGKRLCEENRQAVESEIKQENPSLEDKALRLAVAERIYADDPSAHELLQAIRRELMGENAAAE